MGAPRVFVPIDLLVGCVMQLPAAATRHIQVLRLQPNDEVSLFNGLGTAYRCTIVAMHKQSVQVHIDALEPAAQDLELPFALHLYVGMPANERMDWLVEKATELGVASITPLHCARSVLRLDGERAARRQSHWQNIARAACAQSGRLTVPTIHLPISFAAAVDALAPQQASTWVLCPKARLALRDWQRQLLRQSSESAVRIISGPEGGLDAPERRVLAKHNISGLHLGPRILRAETAPLLVLAALHA